MQRTLNFLLLSLLLFSCKEEANVTNSTAQQTTSKPNVILIMTDDQGWGDLSLNGNPNLSTPNIDAIAEHGVSFENFYVQPVCSPTRAELLTGRHYTKLGVYDTSAGGERLNLGETTIAEILKKEGYRTAAYGKWHSGMQPPYHPNARGFDDFYGFASGHWGNYFSPMLEHNGKIVKGNGFLVDDLTDKGLSFITKNRETPFFLYLPFNTPHSPMQVPDAYWNRFKDRLLKRNYQGSEKEELDFTRAALAMVENIDANVGRIQSKLKELNLEENTIIIFMSDNGPNSWRWNSGMRGRKGSPDEGGVRTPFFMQWKNTLPAGKTIKEIASAIDIVPTLTALTNSKGKTSRALDGKDLSPLLFDTPEEWNSRFVYNSWGNNTSVRSQKYRLDQENRLYDIENDRAQQIDLSAQLPQIRDSLLKAKTKWLKETMPISRAEDDRPFTLGHPDFEYTQLPARDGVAHGNILRSNHYPNDTFFTNWISQKDSITWEIEVLADGKFEVDLYYTLADGNEGVAVQLINGQSTLVTRITASHDPPLRGMENDRFIRGESYVKDFKRKRLGEIFLKKGIGVVTLKAPTIPGTSAMDVRLLNFKRLK